MFVGAQQQIVDIEIDSIYQKDLYVEHKQYSQIQDLRALPDFYIGGTWPNPKDRNHDVPSTKSYEYKERTKLTVMKLIFCI